MNEASATRIHWHDGTVERDDRWRSEAGVAPPKRVVLADDRINADAAHALLSQGTALLWQGDFQNARLLLQAIARRVERPKKQQGPGLRREVAENFHRHRMAQAQRARILGLLLIPLSGDYNVPLRRAPDVAEACGEVWGPPDGHDSVVSLRELQALIGAHEWRKKGVEVPALGERIYPWYGVFSPLRGEYLDLVAAAPLPAALSVQVNEGSPRGSLPPSGGAAAGGGRGHSPAGEAPAFDIGTGTGVIAALLARRGVRRVIATELDERALACARDNLARLGLAGRVTVLAADLFPEGRSPLVVCNPPWLPGKPSSPIERAIYDPDSRMLRGFLAGVGGHLTPGGEAWLILSDFAEHLGLRRRAELETWIAAGGLAVRARHDIRPRHAKVVDRDDPLHLARTAEVTSLWRLVAA